MESKVDQNKRDFIVDVQDTLQILKDEKLQKLEEKTNLKFSRLEDKLKRLEIKLEKEKDDVSTKTSDTLIDVGMALFGAFFGKRTSSLTSMRRGASAFKKGKRVLKEKNDVKNVESLIEDIENDIELLHENFQEDIQKLEDELHIDNYEITSSFVKPRRTDINVKDIAILWRR